MDISGGKLQGPRPTPLKVRKDSHKIRKPPVAPPPPVVIIYTVSPKIIHANPSEFKTLVQRLTGPDSTSTSSSVVVPPPPPSSANHRHAISPADPPSNQNPIGAFLGLSPALHGNENYLETNLMMPSPSSLFNSPISITPSLDLLSNLFDLQHF